MEYVIVTVKRLGEAQVQDIELAINEPVCKLCATLAAGLGWDTDDQGQPVTYIVEAHPPGRFLRPDETLAQAQVWDATWLVLHPQQTVAIPPSPDAPSADSPNPGAGFVWKQVA